MHFLYHKMATLTLHKVCLPQPNRWQDRLNLPCIAATDIASFFNRLGWNLPSPPQEEEQERSLLEGHSTSLLKAEVKIRCFTLYDVCIYACMVYNDKNYWPSSCGTFARMILYHLVQNIYPNFWQVAILDNLR